MTALMVVVVLGGCSRGSTHFDTPSDGEVFLLASLQEKYGVEFVVVANGELEDGWYQRYVATVAPATTPDQSASARVDSRGKLTDAWAVWQFPELWAVPDQACAAVSADVLSCDIYPNMPDRADTWTVETPTDEFFEEASPYVNVQVEFLSTEPETVAPRVLAMLETLDAGPYTYNLFVTQGTGNVIYHHYDSDPMPTLDEVALQVG